MGKGQVIVKWVKNCFCCGRRVGRLSISDIDGEGLVYWDIVEDCGCVIGLEYGEFIYRLCFVKFEMQWQVYSRLKFVGGNKFLYEDLIVGFQCYFSFYGMMIVVVIYQIDFEIMAVSNLIFVDLGRCIDVVDD